MPEVVDQPSGSETGNTGNQQATPPGWLAGLPSDLKDNEAFKSYRTVGDFAKAHLETATKAKEFEGKLANSIPKLGANATPEERDKFQLALGRPSKPEEYEFVNEDKNAPEWTQAWKKDFFELGVPKETAKALSERMDAKVQGMVNAHNAKIQTEIAEAQGKLKTELGDKYDATIELVNRFWKKETDSEFDAAFTGETSANRFTMIRFLAKMAAKTGEDLSPRGSGYRGPAATGNPYPKSNMPPPRA